MKFPLSNEFTLFSILFFVLISVNVNFCRGTDELEEVKPRRGGTVGLFAFPRVGRSDPNLLNWDSNLPNSYEEYDDLSKIEMKRQGLVPFPRVGRADNQLRRWSKLALQQNLEKRSGANANSGLWFGSRLGRIQKRSIDAGAMQGDHL